MKHPDMERICEATTSIFSKQGGLSPMLLILAPGPLDAPSPTPGNLLAVPVSDLMDDKPALARMIREVRTRFAVVFFVSEAWLRKAASEDEAKSGPPPSECADRIEAVVVTRYEGSGAAISFAEIKRPEGRRASLDNWEHIDGDEIGGRLNLPLQNQN